MTIAIVGQQCDVIFLRLAIGEADFPVRLSTLSGIVHPVPVSFYFPLKYLHRFKEGPQYILRIG